MAIGREKQYSLFQLISYTLTACVVVCGATWTVATFLQSNELEAYRKADDWKANETITELRKLSKELNITLSERKEISALRIQAKNLPLLEAQAVKFRAERDALTETLKGLTAETKIFFVKQGQSEYAIPNLLLVGVSSTFAPSARCSVLFGDREESIYVGKYVSGSVSGINYRLSVKQVSDSGCELVYQQVP